VVCQKYPLSKKIKFTEEQAKTCWICVFQCSAGGCLIELAQQLAVIMIGKQIINNAQEIIVPKLKAWWMNKRVSFYLDILNRFLIDF